MSKTTIHVPTPLRRYTGDTPSVDVAGGTVGEALSNLVTQYPDLKPHLYGDDGAIRSFVNVYVGDEDIRHLDREETPLSKGDAISIVPSIAGGSQHTHQTSISTCR